MPCGDLPRIGRIIAENPGEVKAKGLKKGLKRAKGLNRLKGTIGPNWNASGPQKWRSIVER
jgi:hypothetical protein